MVGWFSTPHQERSATRFHFVPVATDSSFWLVRKPGETQGCWSYSPQQRQYIAHFGPVDPPPDGFSQSKLSPDGRSMAWVLAPMPRGWQGGTLRAGSFCKEILRKTTFRSRLSFRLSPGVG